MTKRVTLKYPMGGPVHQFEMPTGARIVNVHTQHGMPTLWALCDEGIANETREFVGFGTGHTIDDDGTLTYVGTAHDVEGVGLVFHIFERDLTGGGTL